jgi:hypothetical protein
MFLRKGGDRSIVGLFIMSKSFLTPQNRLKAFTAIIFLIAVIAGIFLVGSNTKIIWIPTVCFVAFFVLSLKRATTITDGDNLIVQDINTALICGIATISVLLNSPFCFVLATLTTLYFPINIKNRQWTYLFFNFSNELLSAYACYLSLILLDLNVNDSYVIVGLKVLLCSITFNLTNHFILAVSYIVEGEDWKEILEDSRKALIEIIPLALFCGLLGRLYISYGWPMLVMFALPLFIGRELHSSYATMSQGQSSTINTLIYALEEKDAYTGGHVHRVAMFAKYIGQELGYGPKRLERLRQAALLHDTGKLIVPNVLLNKPGKLTDEEFAVIKKHEGVTEEILKAITFLRPIAHTSGGDHNQMDGDKKTRKLEPYIVSVCDAFDAMTSSRSYRKALSMETAFEELEKNKGKQFHPKVVAALIKAIEDRGEHYGDGYEVDSMHADAPIAGVGSAGIGDTIAEEEDELANENTKAATAAHLNKDAAKEGELNG